MTRLALALAVAATAAALSAPAAAALPGQCWNSPFGGFCDTAPQADGSYQHCESYAFGSSSFQNCYQACHDPASNRSVPTDNDYTTPC